MNKELNFYIPDDSNNLPDINIKLLFLLRKRSYLFYDDFRIESVFGNPIGCSWAGGRLSDRNPPPIGDKYFISIPRIYRYLGVSYCLTFSNLLVNKEHLNDSYCNYILKKYNKKGNCVIVSSDILKDYIYSKYKKFKIINSITRCENSIDKINELSKKEITCPPVKFNNDFESLKKFKYPNNIEILCSEVCVEDCPFLKEHYKKISEFNLGLINDQITCMQKRKSSAKNKPIMERKHWVNRKDFCKYLDIGINKFKLSGRRNSKEGLVSLYSLFFVKEEHKDTFNYFMDLPMEDFLKSLKVSPLRRRWILKNLNTLSFYNDLNICSNKNEFNL